MQQEGLQQVGLQKVVSQQLGRQQVVLQHVVWQQLSWPQPCSEQTEPHEELTMVLEVGDAGFSCKRTCKPLCFNKNIAAKGSEPRGPHQASQQHEQKRCSAVVLWAAAGISTAMNMLDYTLSQELALTGWRCPLGVPGDALFIKVLEKSRHWGLQQLGWQQLEMQQEGLQQVVLQQVVWQQEGGQQLEMQHWGLQQLGWQQLEMQQEGLQQVVLQQVVMSLLAHNALGEQRKGKFTLA
ncbi:hypothetical protein H920_19828 [Fukomys damarensis]|uniref:Uncharacterized protein n=1 Tax=Fukomys damarensis TaxID=885580 RepID=A0A091CJR9_FUKDA|nr:hypothetical protein H920_19828 [Fukomys damarensis]